MSTASVDTDFPRSILICTLSGSNETCRPITASISSRRTLSRSPAALANGYAVQVTSERSESRAQASFRALQEKYPSQLSGRKLIIRRADLGVAGIYYRALVGPFASAEKAAKLCSGLKAA